MEFSPILKKLIIFTFHFSLFTFTSLHFTYDKAREVATRLPRFSLTRQGKSTLAGKSPLVTVFFTVFVTLFVTVFVTLLVTY